VVHDQRFHGGGLDVQVSLVLVLCRKNLLVENQATVVIYADLLALRAPFAASQSGSKAITDGAEY
jgi:hypothetical protein